MTKKEMSLNSVLFQCTRGKSFIARKPEVHSIFFKFLKTFLKCIPPDFIFYLGELNNKHFPIRCNVNFLSVFNALNNTKKKKAKKI